jgi:tetratricopeptide (TPR) repeat protein
VSIAAASNSRAQDLVPAPPDFHPDKPKIGEMVLPQFEGGSRAVIADDPSRDDLMISAGDGVIFDRAPSVSTRIQEHQEALQRAADHLARAGAHMKRGEKVLALAECETALECDPDSRFARLMRSCVFMALERHADALADVEYVIAREPDNVAALRSRASFAFAVALAGNGKSLGDAEKAVADVLRREPSDPRMRSYRGIIAGKNGDAKGAIADLSYAIAHGVRWKGAYESLAAARIQTGDFRAALKDINQVAPLYGSAPLPLQLLWQRAHCYSKLGEIDRAIADYTTIITRDPKEYRVYRDRADVYVQKHDFKLALADQDAAVRLRPDDPESYLRRSFVRWRNGDTQGALADVDRMARLQPESNAPPIWAAVMVILAGQDIGAALASLDRAIALDPNFALSYGLRAYVRGKKAEWLLGAADVVLAIRRLALVEFKVHFERTRLDDGRDGVTFRIEWEYKGGEDNPARKNEASRVERETIEFGMNSLLAAMLAPRSP